ncbi:MAG TPA: SRPBCC family protein [Nocardioidaceae bacterium]|nr:SRPBCC family protein [Nocardioidaceae bacterium]
MQNPERSTGRLVKALGLASIGLGVPMLRSTDEVARITGVDDSPIAPTMIRAVGAREMVHAGLLLLGPQRSVWTRVAGDAMDIATLGIALQSRSGERRRRTATALLAVLGITGLDLYAARRTAKQQHGKGRPGPLELHASTTVNRDPQEVYTFWRDFENLPSFMLHLKQVSANGDGRSRWVANAPVRRSVKWDAELTGDEPGRRISWKSLPGADIDNSGTVHFAPAPGHRGTEVRVDLHYDVPGGRLGRVAAKLFGEEPEQQVRDDLRRFKQVIETGDIVRSDALPHGTDARHQIVQRPAQPPKGKKARTHR